VPIPHAPVQEVPSATLVWLHATLFWSPDSVQTSTVQLFESPQSVGTLRQAPDWQMSVVHGFPSVIAHGAPSAKLVLVQRT
jgi:hypothetical protein